MQANVARTIPFAHVTESTVQRPYSQRSLQSRTLAQTTTSSTVVSLDEVSSTTTIMQYTAHYQLLQDTTCRGPAPVVRVACRGAGIAVQRTSDPTIVCNDRVQVDATTGWSFMDCINTCQPDDACARNVYLQVDSSVDLGPFGQIDFVCSAQNNDSADLEATITFMESGNGECGDSSLGLTRNLHILRMGVSCPNLASSNHSTSNTLNATNTTLHPTNATTEAVPSLRDYIFDDYYFECVPSTASYPLGYNYYTCIVGGSCDGIACTVDFEPIVITTNLAALLQDCQINTTRSTTPSPTIVPDNNVYTFTTRFVASWGLLFDPITTDDCTGFTPTVQVDCLAGSVIALSRRTSHAASLNCTQPNLSRLVCTDTNPSHFVDRFASVDYVRKTQGTQACENNAHVHAC
jgi:hypothetical protein